MTLRDKYEEIYKIHIDQLCLKNLVDIANPSLVVFSAIPGSGKSELSRRLEHDCAYLLITNKLIRETIVKSEHDDIIIGDYTVWFLNKLTRECRPNIVFDRNIDQWYEESKEWAKENKYQYVLVSINVAMDILTKRLFSRENTMTSGAHETLGFYSEQHKEIQKYMDATVSFTDNYDIGTAAESISKAKV